MIAAHGASLSVDTQGVHILYSGLTAALRGMTVDGNDITVGALRTVPLVDITDVSSTAPTSVLQGEVLLHGADVRVEFSPNQAPQVERFVTAVQQALAGEAPSTSGIPGLSGVAVFVFPANAAWESVCRVSAAQLVDGSVSATSTFTWALPEESGGCDPEVAQRTGLTCDALATAAPAEQVIPELLDFLGDGPLIAHNASFHVSALRKSLQAAGDFDLSGQFACTLALSRASALKVDTHGLVDVAQALGLNASEPEDYGRLTAEVLAALVRRAQHSGSVMDVVHAAGFTLGEVKENALVPVLQDRSGAGRALQATGDPLESSGGAGTDFRDSDTSSTAQAEGSSESKRRGPAPWHSVATPDDIPEPNEAADPNNPLFDQTVVLTGEFEPYDKGQLWSGIAHLGGQVAKNVTKKTTILVVGTWASKTSKEKKAEEYRDKGQDIQIWQGDQLLDVLGLNEDPPF